MSKKKDTGIFWIGYSDLMTSLFFIVLVLFVITYISQQRQVENLQKKLAVYNMVEENIKPLKKNNDLFKYEKEYKRFVLSFDVKYGVSKVEIKEGDLLNYETTSEKILDAGLELKKIVDQLEKDKKNNKTLSNVSYIVIISGYASKFLKPNLKEDYQLSYLRAFNLWKFWIDKGINFEDKKYNGLIDLQISGNGWGGVGRHFYEIENRNNENQVNKFYKTEFKNQRFIIQIVPKISNTDEE
ncbi:hypothetical protein SAMN05421738_108153 [Algoriella xinjiangensis]|uniref:OmpA family protein n=1 Tax=Algoriella xinjiangensis TaxID=684065 RepID=A0A1I4X8N8_9FLAO|nr:hypothetical protein [Algoriella xinjiangensis]SFN22321.1 hypothetical protein SAMN05421738_108153 [Algoriella xinjiangensis]VDH14803.1 Uncharacterised protein [Algoriella xinjiangensis]